MKRILRLFIVMVGFTVLFATCTEKEKNTARLNSRVDLLSSTLKTDENSAVLVYSTDGTHYDTFFPSLAVGQTFKVKVLHGASAAQLKATDFYTFDWSASTPAPDDATSENPTFTFDGNSFIRVKVLDQFCPLNVSTFTGAWNGDEVGACCGGTDHLNLSVDGSNPNRINMTNFWGDGPSVVVYAIFSASTTPFDQVVTIPLQTTSEGGVASGTGTYDQCRGTFTIATTYKIGGSTYSWQYNFYK